MNSTNTMLWFDRTVATLIVILMSPFIFLRFLYGFFKTGKIIERQWVETSSGLIGVFKLPGYFRGRNIGVLFNVMCADVAFIGDGPLLDSVIARQRLDDSNLSISLEAHPCLINIKNVHEISANRYSGANLTCLNYVKKISLILKYGLLRGLVRKGNLSRPDRFTMLNISIENVTVDEAVESVIESVKIKDKARMAFINAKYLNYAYRNSSYLDVLSKQSKVFADGVGVKVGAQILGVELKTNDRDEDLLSSLCKRCVSDNLSIYLLGEHAKLVRKAEEALQDTYKGIQIAGAKSGCFSEETIDGLISEINDTKADIVLVASSESSQLMWMEQCSEFIDAPLLLSVHGLLDSQKIFYSRAPQWVQGIGAQRLWGCSQMSMRFFKRYMIEIPLFIHRVRMQARVDSNYVNYKRFSNPYAEAKNNNKRYVRKQYFWLMRFQFSRVCKRFVDIAGSGCALIIFSPILLIAAFLIKLDSGPILFRQQRVGRYGQVFQMLKFRSMRTDAEKVKSDLLQSNEVDGGVIFKMKQDPRITSVGKYLRKYSIDELPQLINVLRGEMSLVGPRPPLTTEVDLYTGRDRRRLEVTPGITGLWQVSGRSDTTFEQQVDLDIDYIESRGILNDILILLKTVPAVLSGRGAY